MENNKIAKYLLEIKAVKLSPNNPFTWASGIKSPIYCDNRKTLSYPKVRKHITAEFVKQIKTEFPDVEVIAGVATGAIALGVLVADEMNLPFIYVRSSSKGHGLQNKIEGFVEKGKKIVVIEDLISTGGSSIEAVKALREAETTVLGLSAIFTYGLKKATDNFEKADCKFFTLSNYEILIDEALENSYIKNEDLKILQDWKNK